MIDNALELTKARIGLRSDVRDEYIQHIVKSVVKELESEYGLSLDSDNPYHTMFVVDWSDWRYSNRDAPEAMPRHLQFRLHNMIISNVGEKDV